MWHCRCQPHFSSLSCAHSLHVVWVQPDNIKFAICLTIPIACIPLRCQYLLHHHKVSRALCFVRRMAASVNDVMPVCTCFTPPQTESTKLFVDAQRLCNHLFSAVVSTQLLTPSAVLVTRLQQAQKPTHGQQERKVIKCGSVIQSMKTNTQQQELQCSLDTMNTYTELARP